VARGLRALDRLGAVLCLAGALALLLLPFVDLKPNRILPGNPRLLHQVLPLAAAIAAYALLGAAGAVALLVANARVRILAAVLGLIVIGWALASGADALTPPGNRVVRVAAGTGFWVLLLTLGLMAADGITRLRPGPALRVALLLGALGICAFLLSHGTFDNVSVVREYAVNAARFGHEVRQHIVLAMGSLLAGAVVALPTGVVCHRVPRLRPGVLGTLNVIQTIPAIALFGILMAPLGALAAALPVTARLGISGIGTAPAVVALFLYTLLPIVANTSAGLARVSPATVEAARGMGMTSWQSLTSVELALALPVIITGVRIALVQNIGMATIAALIGGGGLGTFVFQGIGQTAIDLVLLGAIPTVALAFSCAVVLDAVVEVLHRGRA